MPDITTPPGANLSGQLFQIWPMAEWQLVADAEVMRNAGGSRENVDLKIAEYRANAMQLDRLPVEIDGGVAVISISGPIYKPRSFWRSSWLDLQETFRFCRETDQVESVLLKIDTPGGSVDGSAEACDELRLLVAEKPVETQVTGMLCSAGYKLAAITERITAQRADLIGSIGTKMVLYDFNRAFSEAGIRPVGVTTAPFKLLGVPGFEITEEHEEFLQSLVTGMNADFRSTVIQGRELTDEQYEAVSDGKVWMPDEAMRLGMIDAIGTFEQTLGRLQAASNSNHTRTTQGTGMTTKSTQQAEATKKPGDESTGSTPTQKTETPTTETAEPKQDAGTVTGNTVEGGRIESGTRESVTTELDRFCGAFGTEHGLKYFRSNMTFEEATEAHNRELQSQLKTTQEEMDKLRQQLSATEPLGEDTPLETGETEDGKALSFVDVFTGK